MTWLSAKNVNGLKPCKLCCYVKEDTYWFTCYDFFPYKLYGNLKITCKWTFSKKTFVFCSLLKSPLTIPFWNKSLQKYQGTFSSYNRNIYLKPHSNLIVVCSEPFRKLTTLNNHTSEWFTFHFKLKSGKSSNFTITFYPSSLPQRSSWGNDFFFQLPTIIFSTEAQSTLLTIYSPVSLLAYISAMLFYVKIKQHNMFANQLARLISCS